MGFEEYISVSNTGRMYFKPREFTRYNTDKVFMAGDIFPKYSNDKDGYQMVGLSIQGKRSVIKVHRLILSTFNNADGWQELEVNHIDGDKANNHIDNLEWVTRQENIDHAVETGLIFSPKDYFMMGKEKRSYLGTKKCEQCNMEFKLKDIKNKFCNPQCSALSLRRAERPNKEVLYQELIDKPFTTVAKKYGVSHTSIRKWCQSYGIPHKSSYYSNERKKGR